MPGEIRDASGHLIGVDYTLLPAGHELHYWNDQPLGPNHPLARNMDPRCFIPGVAARSPSPPRFSDVVQLEAPHEPVPISATYALQLSAIATAAAGRTSGSGESAGTQEQQQLATPPPSQGDATSAE